MSRPVVALLTDFGLRDHYVGTMKGVILGICPDVSLVDITHDIPPHDVQAGALELAAAYRYFPTGTIFLVVVDPGVGSTRRGLAAEAGDFRFVAPDNGVLSLIGEESGPRKIVELTDRRYARPTVSHTFEGRDRFAPAAAWLARGVALTTLGRPVVSIERIELRRPVSAADRLDGEVVRVDRFGNLITNIDRRTFDRFRDHAAYGSTARDCIVHVGGRLVSRLVSTYADAAPGEVCGLFGSTDHLEIAVRGASAAEALGLSRGSAVHVTHAA
jgi:S-adenosylmethionine hydrolase